MATTSATTNYSFPYPLGSDSLSNLATRIKELAEYIDSTYTILGVNLSSSAAFLQTGDAAGGSLTGTYPNPTISTSVVTSAMIVDGTITGSDIASNTITGTNIISSVNLLGNPTTTTQSTVDDSTKIATTEFVNDVAANFVLGIVSSGSITNAMLAGSITYANLILTGSIVNADVATGAAIAYSKLNLAASITSSDIVDGTIVNADINVSAAINKTKISGTAVTVADTGTVTSTMILDDTILNNDINASAAIAYSKLNLATSIVNADINASAAIAYSKLALTGAVLNADLAGSIADSKLSTIATALKVSNSATTATDANTASAIVARNASGNFTAGTITAALTGNASTATSATSATTATTATNIAGGLGGSIPYQTAVNATALLANGTAGQVLTSAGTTLAPTWTVPVGATHAANHISGGSDPVVGDSISSAGSYTSWTATSSTIGGQLSGINSALAMTQNAQTASYTLVLTDRNKLVEISNASANNLTVPLNSSVAYPVGSQITILQTGAGQTTIVATGGVTINATPGLKLRTQWSSATLVKRATDTWVAIGDLTA